MATEWLPWQQLKDQRFKGMLWPGIYLVIPRQVSKTR